MIVAFQNTPAESADFESGCLRQKLIRMRCDKITHLPKYATMRHGIIAAESR
jgi:hypothetical protein